MPRPDPQIREQTAAQRRATLAVLETLTPQQWRHDSSCDGWTIHELVAHLTLPFSPQRRVLKEMVRARGRFDLAADAMAREDAAAHDPEQLIDLLRANVDHPWSPPGGGPAGALSHDVIHSFDVTDPLGLPPVVTPDRAAAVLTNFRPHHLRGFGVDLRRTRFEADDGDLSIGPDRSTAERTVVAPLVDLVPLATGRRTRAA